LAAKDTTRDGDADEPAHADGQSAENEAAESSTTEGSQGPRAKVWLALVVIAIFEMWLFGRRGHIELCVAREGVHDFALLDTPRTDDNTRRYPTCEKRLNIGITSHFEQAIEDAALHACRRANILRSKEEAIACVLQQAGWQRRTRTTWCPPTHDHYYKRLFWFAFDD